MLQHRGLAARTPERSPAQLRIGAAAFTTACDHCLALRPSVKAAIEELAGRPAAALEAVWARLPRLDLLQANSKNHCECAKSNPWISRGNFAAHLQSPVQLFQL
jgi:hypothetical protein